MTLQEVKEWKARKFNNWEYQLKYYKDFDYSILRHIIYEVRPSNKRERFNDCIIMLDTETSKKTQGSVGEANHIVAFTISLRAYDKNICTLYGYDPVECVDCIFLLTEAMQGDHTIFYVHNLAYDWVFLRKFLIQEMGTPIHQLNTKSHYPIMIEFANGVIFKDSYILAQRSLDKWGKDMQVEHGKAQGKWDYDKIRNQHESEFTQDELEYIEHDTLCGVECIQKLKDMLNKHIYNMPYTATGIPREEARKRGAQNGARKYFNKIHLELDEYLTAEKVYHGGYTHANRHYTGVVFGSIENPVKCYDFTSSYPYCLLTMKAPCEKFTRGSDCSIESILKNKGNYAYMFKLIVIGAKLKDVNTGMPAFQFSKCVKCVNPILDNGRILQCDYAEIYLNEIDLEVLNTQYTFEKHLCCDLYLAYKDYLPHWFTDYVFQLFSDKCTLKGGDPVLYALAKAKLNSLYGMCVQKCIKELISEDYETGEYITASGNAEELYNTYLNSIKSVLLYTWGVWCTSTAFKNLLLGLAPCAGVHLYSDTDSCYGLEWDMEKLNAYNESCKEQLKANGYGAVEYNGKEYWLGVATFDGAYSEYKTLHSKCYCGRSVEDGELHITVAGVPKRASAQLNNDINNFKDGFVFSGKQSGKKTHTYIQAEEIYTDKNGNITGDSIDLSECDYLINAFEVQSIKDALTEEVYIQVYE